MKIDGQIKKLMNPFFICDTILKRISPYIKNDEMYLKIHYFLCMQKKLKLNPPRTFNEKLQWLKLNDKHQSYSMMVDKYDVKKYVSEQIGEKYVIPTLAIWNNVNEIDLNLLPNQFVLKCTHDSQSFVICRNKGELDISQAKRKLSKSMKKNKWYYQGREYPYKGLQPRIIAEKFLVDESGTELKDYKFFCFNGIPRMLLIVSGRGGDQRQDFYDMNFNLLPVHRKEHPNSGVKRIPPKNFDVMQNLAEKLSKGIPHVRVDFYNINGKIYFGELTFFSGGGDTRFVPDEWDYIIGDWLKLPQLI